MSRSHLRSWVHALAAAMVLVGAGCTMARSDSREPSARGSAAVAADNIPIDSGAFEPGRLGAAVFQETNRIRRELGLRPCEPLRELDEAADIQASADALGQNASHDNVIGTLATPYLRIRRAGLRPGSVAENAALTPLLNLDPSHGYIERRTESGLVRLDGQTLAELQPHTYASFAQAVLRQWMNSPGHRANIVNPEFRYLGCSGRPTRVLNGITMIATIQDFYLPAGPR